MVGSLGSHVGGLSNSIWYYLNEVPSCRGNTTLKVSTTRDRTRLSEHSGILPATATQMALESLQPMHLVLGLEFEKIRVAHLKCTILSLH